MANPQPFLGKVITITGAARGLGLATAVYLAVHGADLSLADVLQNELELDKNKIQQKYPDRRIESFQVNVANSASVNAWIQETIDLFGKIDGCVNNAGIAGELKPLTDLTDAGFSRTLAVNLNGVFHCLRAQLRVISPGGSIVNTASTMGLRGLPGAAAYCASKHGVIGLTKVAAKEAGSRNVRVNAICPGMVNTAMLSEFEEYNGGQIIDDLNTQAAVHRLAEPVELTGMIGHLLGDESRYTTGSIINVDGGCSC